MCEAFGGGGGISVWMNLVCTNLGGTAPRVSHPGVGMNLISSLPHTSAGAVWVVGGGDVWVVGNRDVVEDVDGDRDVSPWANVWDGPVSSWSPCHNQCPNTSHLLSNLSSPWCGHAWVCVADQMWAWVCDVDQMWA